MQCFRPLEHTAANALGPKANTNTNTNAIPITIPIQLPGKLRARQCSAALDLLRIGPPMHLRTQGHLNCLQFAHFHPQPGKHCLLKLAHPPPHLRSSQSKSSAYKSNKSNNVPKVLLLHPVTPSLSHRNWIYLFEVLVSIMINVIESCDDEVIMMHCGCILQSAAHTVLPHTLGTVLYQALQHHTVPHRFIHYHTVP